MDEDRIVLQLPGMTLNRTIFPDLGERCIGPDFSRLVVGSDGTSPELLRRRMGFYSGLLDSFLDQTLEWQAPAKLIVAHSFGGMLALRWLADQGVESATRVSGLVLIATTAGPMYDQLSLRLGRMGSEGSGCNSCSIHLRKLSLWLCTL